MHRLDRLSARAGVSHNQQTSFRARPGTAFRRGRRLLAVLSVACAALAARQTAAADGVWTVAGTNSWAAAQSTSTGRILGALQGWDGKLYSGYGDYSANTGPIRLMAFDPATGTFTNEFTFETEAIYVFRPLFGRLYVPPIDPTWRSGIAVRKVSTGWSFQPVYMEHGFDIATLTGGDLWLVGSYGDHLSQAMRSLDDGVTWQTGRQEVYLNDDYSRFYFAAALSGKLYLQSSSTNACSIFDGTTWQHGVNVSRYGSLAREFADKIVLLSRHSTPNDSGDLLAFNGRQAPAVELGSIYNYTVSGGALYTVGADRAVRRTTNLKAWSVLASNAPRGSRSIAVLDNRIYVGTTNAEIHVYSTPVGTLPVVRVVPSHESAEERHAVPGVFTVRRGGAAGSSLTVRFSLSGTAASGADYTPSATGAVTIPAGADSATVDIVPAEDRTIEGSEFVNLTLTPDASYAIETPADARILIDDARIIALDPASVNLAESAGTATVVVRMSAPLGVPVSVPYALSGTATPGSDVTIPASPLVIAAGSTNALLPISIIDDTAPESDETLVVTLGTPTNALLSASATVYALTILDEDWLPRLVNVEAANVAPTGAHVTGFLMSTGASATAVSAFWGASDGGTDPSAWDHHSTLPAPQPEGAFALAATGLAANDTCYYRVAASNASGVVWSPAHAFFITGAIAVETAANAAEAGLVPGLFIVSRPATAAAEATLVRFSISGTAIPGADYVHDVGATVPIPPGAAAASVVVTPLLNWANTNNTTVILTLLPGAYVPGVPASAALTISNRAPRVICVDAAAPGPLHDGTSRATAYTTIQEAVSSPAFSSASGTLVRVYGGIYPETVALGADDSGVIGSPNWLEASFGDTVVIDGGGIRAHGVCGTNLASFVLTRIGVTNVAAAGIALTGATNCTLSDCMSSGNAGSGLLLQGGASLEVLGGVYSGNIRHGVDLAGTAGCRLQAVRAGNNRGFGVAASSATACVLTNVTVWASGRSGILVSNSVGSLVSACTVTNNAANGLYLHNANNAVIHDSLFGRNLAAGVRSGINQTAAGSDNVVMRRNRMLRNAGDGLLVPRDSRSDNWLVDGCLVYGNGGTGISKDAWNSGWRLTNSILVANHFYDIVASAEYGTGVTISYTDLYAARAHAIPDGRNFIAGSGNLSTDPGFVAPWADDFRLYAGAPAAGAGAGGEDLGPWPRGPAVARPTIETYHVRPDGHDANDGLENTPSGAFRTIQAAANAATVGDTVMIHEGTYNEAVVVPAGGSGEVWLRFIANGNVSITHAVGPAITLRGVHRVAFQGVTCTSGNTGVELDEAIGCRFTACTFGASRLSGVRLNRAHANQFIECTVRNNGANGVLVYQSGEPLFERCRLFGNTGAGIFSGKYGGGTIAGGNWGVVRSSLLWLNTGWGFGTARDSSSSNWTIENSVFDGNGGGIHVDYYGGDATMIRNTLVTYNTGSGISRGTQYAMTLLNNDVFANGANYVGTLTPVNSLSIDPLYRDRAGRDYAVRYRSPCVNAGTNQTWMTGAVDLAGTARIGGGIVDIGAYEVAGTGTLMVLR